MVYKESEKWNQDVIKANFGYLTPIDANNVPNMIDTWTGVKNKLDRSIKGGGWTSNTNIISTYSYTNAGGGYNYSYTCLLDMEENVHIINNLAIMLLVGSSFFNTKFNTKTKTFSTYSIDTTSFPSYGVLDTNGNIHFIPAANTAVTLDGTYYGAMNGQKISPTGIVTTYSLVDNCSYVNTEYVYPYNGGVLTPNGDIHFIPGAAIVGQKVSSAGVVSTYSLPQPSLSGDGWAGILAPSTGEIYLIPRSPSDDPFMKIDVNGVISTISPLYANTIYISSVTTDAQGRILIYPLTSSSPSNTIIRYDPLVKTYANINIAPYNNYERGGGTLLPQGDIIFVPNSQTTAGVLKISTSDIVSTYSMPGNMISTKPATTSKGEVYFGGIGYSTTPNTMYVLNTTPAVPWDSALATSPWVNGNQV